ncbi:hypothetical protein WI94_19305 [Burkholderia vietnamiensis]|nr:hypothetical protein WI94_19305 [Burkholderia vietnamiensis]
MFARSESVGDGVLRNVCTKVTPELADRIDAAVSLLGVSKRRFLEAAFIEALLKVEDLMRAEGVGDGSLQELIRSKMAARSDES